MFYFVNCLNIILTWLLPLETLLLHSMPVILFRCLLHGTYICLVDNCVLPFGLLLSKMFPSGAAGSVVVVLVLLCPMQTAVDG